MTKTRKEKPIIVEKIFNLILELNGQEYKAEGENFEDSISQIKPVKFSTRGILNAFKDNKKATIMLNILQMKRLFGNCGNTTQKIVIGFFNKRIDQLLK